MNRVHVIPCNDLIEHTNEDDDCVCGPDVEFVSGGAVIVHHSLDGRELTEDGLPAPEVYLAAHEAREILEEETG